MAPSSGERSMERRYVVRDLCLCLESGELVSGNQSCTRLHQASPLTRCPVPCCSTS